MKLTTVINTYNEEKNIKRVISSISSISDEILVVDMNSQDATSQLAKTLGAKVITVANTGYVEPARNIGIDQAIGEYILILDADEEITPQLAKTIKEKLVKKSDTTFYRFARKNIIFNTWIKHGLWWPDYQIRLFRKGCVTWQEEIHSVPYTKGVGYDFPSHEDYAIIHYNYQTIEQYITRMNRYTSIQANEKRKTKIDFSWTKIVTNPSQEFLRRFFLAEGYKDGLHGLTLASLQAFSELVVILKFWEMEKYKEINSSDLKKQIPKLFEKNHKDIFYWLGEKHFVNFVTARIKTLFS